MNRREFVRHAGLAAAAVSAKPRMAFALGAEKPLTGKLTVDESTKLATIPPDYMGLSYESAQLANPAFFAAENKQLIALFRALGEEGVLRLGGGTSEFTAFNPEAQIIQPPFDAVGPDTSKNVKSDTPITLKSLQNLRAFLDATGWRCLYGLNLGRGTKERAADEAHYAQQILESRLIAFQLGNEPDAWRNRYRPATWTYADYAKEWDAARLAVLARLPQAKFAGPDISNKIDYLTGFAVDATKPTSDVVMLTSHYYAMGPAGAKDVTLEKLLSPDAKLERDLKIAMSAAQRAGIPYRMCEGNSCWNGGQHGVSDTLASALWVVDMMLNFASFGCAGVNLHGGGNGFYTPIAGSLATGFMARPEYFGMMLARQFVGATLLGTQLDCSSDKIRAFAAVKNGMQMLTLINKTESTVAIDTSLHHLREQWLLAGAAIDAQDGVSLKRVPNHAVKGGLVHLLPYSAVLIKE